MNEYYKTALETYHDRRPVFEFVIDNYLKKIDNPWIVEVGSIRGQPSDIYGDGLSAVYWADFLLKYKNGKLTIVDIDPEAINKTKEALSDFVGKIDLEFVCDDCLDFYKKKRGEPNFLYADGPDAEWVTFELFRLVDRTKTFVLIDDANGWEKGEGKCVRTRKHYSDYKTFKCNYIHEMIFYNTISK